MATKSTNANSKPRKGEHVDPEQKIETALDKTELFFQKYTKQLLTGLLVVVIVVGGYFAYEYLVKRPRAVKAARDDVRCRTAFRSRGLYGRTRGRRQQCRFSRRRFTVRRHPSGTSRGPLCRRVLHEARRFRFGNGVPQQIQKGKRSAWRDNQRAELRTQGRHLRRTRRLRPRPRCCMPRLRMLPTMCSPLLIISANLPSYMPNSAGWRRL